ncbi:MAG: hypothetical protein UY79_C0002G0027 [Parcubacteria group bacterium GW2011_GWA2_53_21]|nr:MAG: hypothetical protein UY79_C0002G0027 [Parcubacteria group bacterium GW2011_GWA2_53_21]
MAKTGTTQKQRLGQIHSELVKNYEDILKRLVVLQKKRAVLHKEILAALDRAKARNVLEKIKRMS